jgi:hypothetical protein
LIQAQEEGRFMAILLRRAAMLRAAAKLPPIHCDWLERAPLGLMANPGGFCALHRHSTLQSKRKAL